MNNKLIIIGLIAIVGAAGLFMANQQTDWFGGGDQKALEITEAKNRKKFDLSESQVKQIEEQGFVLSKGESKEIYEIYSQNHIKGLPNFITTDIVLHTTHLLYNYSLKAVEQRTLIDKVKEVSKTMVELTEKQYRSLEGGRLKQASKLNLAFFSVAYGLLNPSWEVPNPVSKVVNNELKLINRNKKAGIRTSPLLGYSLNYGSFLPRGDYRRSNQLKRYFKAINWYGNVYFRLQPGGSEESGITSNQEVLGALLMVKLFDSNQELLDKWSEVNNLLTEFSGRPDNLQVSIYLSLAKNIFGNGLTFEDLRDENRVEAFIEKANDKRKPTSLPLWAARQRVSLKNSQGFCFFSKRFDRSTKVFQDLIYPNVGTKDNPRKIPTGLDVMAVMGSIEAEKLLEAKGEYEYENYTSRLKELKDNFAELRPDEGSTDKDNLKYSWWKVLEKLTGAQVVSSRTNLGEDWDRKQLNTALGSWTELKHDTLLYAKKSTAMARGVVTVTDGYVEPRPEVYRATVSFVKKLKKAQGIPTSLDKKFEEFIALVNSLAKISEIELSGERLSESDYDEIFSAGSKLSEIALPPSFLTDETSEAGMPLVVDVHQDPQSGLVLQEVVGKPLEVIALVKVNGSTKLVKGGTYSHYEFTRSTDQVLNDSEWVQLLDSANKPSLPGWLPMAPSRS